MRRLVADLLLLARADAGREPPHRPVDLSERRHRRGVRARAGRRRPRDLDLGAPRALEIDGARDELHRLVLNLMENALRHTDPGTAVEASVERVNGEVVLAVEDDGPGHPARAAGQGLRALLPRRTATARARPASASRSSARWPSPTSGSVTLEPPLDGRGARFVVRFPAAH